jgi:hypothetical protein
LSALIALILLKCFGRWYARGTTLLTAHWPGSGPVDQHECLARAHIADFHICGT